MNQAEFQKRLVKLSGRPKKLISFIDKLCEKVGKNGGESNHISEWIVEDFDFLANCLKMDIKKVILSLDNYVMNEIEMKEFLENNLYKMMLLVQNKDDFVTLSDFLKFELELDDKFINECVNHNLKNVWHLPVKKCKYLYFLMALSDKTFLFTDANKMIMNEYLKYQKKSYVWFLLGAKIVYDPKFKVGKDIEDVKDIIVMIVDELLEHEGLDYADIQVYTGGAYSNVVKIGSKILKVGCERETFYMLPDDGIVFPLIRINLFDYSDVHGTIEVVEVIDTDIEERISKEDLYQFYKARRMQGQIYADLKYDNMGILLKDNIVHWDKAIGLEGIARGFFGESSTPPFKAGSLVCCDSDYVYSLYLFDELYESGKICWGGPGSFSCEFERRYREEFGMLDEDKMGYFDRIFDALVEKRNKIKKLRKK